MDSQERNGIAAFIEFTEVQETNLYDNIPSLFAAVETSIVNDALPITAPVEEHRPVTPLSPRSHAVSSQMRELIKHHCVDNNMSISDCAKLLKIGRSTVSKIVSTGLARGSFERQSKGGRKKLLTDAHRKLLKMLVRFFIL